MAALRGTQPLAPKSPPTVVVSQPADTPWEYCAHDTLQTVDWAGIQRPLGCDWAL